MEHAGALAGMSWCEEVDCMVATTGPMCACVQVCVFVGAIACMSWCEELDCMVANIGPKVRLRAGVCVCGVHVGAIAYMSLCKKWAACVKKWTAWWPTLGPCVLACRSVFMERKQVQMQAWVCVKKWIARWARVCLRAGLCIFGLHVGALASMGLCEEVDCTVATLVGPMWSGPCVLACRSVCVCEVHAGALARIDRV